VRIGSRSEAKAQEAARGIPGDVTGHSNADAVSDAGIVVLTVPLAAQVETLKTIRGGLAPGSVVVDTTVPLEIAIGGRISRVLTLWDGSAAQQAARMLPGVQVVAAFHALSAEALAHVDEPLECDTLIPGVRAIDAGPLDNARLLENSAALLISLNLRHKVKHSGMRITGLPAKAGAV